MRTIENFCARLVREILFFHSAVKSEVGTVIDQFYKYRRYSVTITLQIEQYSLSFSHVGSGCPMTNQILIGNNDPSNFPNETSCVENISVVDTLDLTRNRDVSLDCACSAEKVYCRCLSESSHSRIPENHSPCCHPAHKRFMNPYHGFLISAKYQWDWHT